MKTIRETSQEAMALGDQAARLIGPLLAGRGPEVQSAVLADLTARWLSGYRGPGAAEMRERMLEHYLRYIRLLVASGDNPMN